MSFYRTIFRFVHRSFSVSLSTDAATMNHHPHLLAPLRSFAFSSAEEAAAERRRRKRKLRMEPPLHALRRDPSTPRPRVDPNAPRLPDTTSTLVGPRLNLHNRVQSLIRAGDLDLASLTARQSVFSHIRPTVFTCNAIIAAMYRAKRFDDAVALFQYFFVQCNLVPNVVSYNFLINTHCDAARVDVALDAYRHILANAPFSPSAVTYRHLTKGLIDASRISEAVDLLREMLSKGHGADSLVFNNLISGFLAAGNLEKANELFDELKDRCAVYDGVVTATYMNWFFARGSEKEAMECYRSYRDRKFPLIPATGNVLLETLLKHGRNVEAWELFDQMLDNHTPPTFQAVNSDTFGVMVNECVKVGKFSEALNVFKKSGTKPRSKPFAMDVAGYNNIIGKFCENGLLMEAEKLLGEVSTRSLTPDVTTYRTFIHAYFKAERTEDALQMFDRMVESGLRVIPALANKWLDELIKRDRAVDASHMLAKMGGRDPKPDASSYELVIKGLCDCGLLDVCRDFLMRHNVALTSSLREFLYEAFGKAGRGDEIQKLIGARCQDRTPPVPDDPTLPPV